MCTISVISDFKDDLNIAQIFAGRGQVILGLLHRCDWSRPIYNLTPKINKLSD